MVKPLLPLLFGALSVAALPSTTSTNSSIAALNSQGFEVVIVYVEPEEGCSATQCSPEEPFASSTFLPSPSASSSTSSSKASTSSTSSADEPLFSQSGSNSKLLPNVHWSTNTGPATNVIPLPIGSGSPFYYGNPDSSQAGYFGFLTYYFTSPSVNLDHCDHISEVIVVDTGLKITFATSQAYNYAVQHWSADEELILITYTEGCPGYDDGERCYLKITGIEFLGSVVVVEGEFCEDTNKIISSGETEWGWWVPRYNGTSSSGSSGSASGSGSTVTWSGSSSSSPSATVYASTIASSVASSSPTSTSTTGIYSNSTSTSNSTVSVVNGTDVDNFADSNSSCVPPVDTKYGLPTACLGDLFDKDLDDDLGYLANISTDFFDFLEYLAPEVEDDSTPSDEDSADDFGDAVDLDSTTRRRSLIRRQKQLTKRFCFSCALKKAVSYVTHPVDTLNAIKTVVQQATSISGSINKDLSFQVPNPANAESSKLQDSSTKQVTSPWGDSILLKAFGDQSSVGSDGLHGYMNVFCVGCGVSGHASVAGRASWTPLGGFTQGQVEMHADVQFVFKLGIDAQMTYQKEFSNALLRLGLPGLTYGVVTIGPWVEVGSTVTLDAEAKGRLLAGAEMGLQAAHVLVDFINPSNSQKDGWEPYFKPVFQAEGELMLSASLGLPMGLKCGLQIATFSKSVGIIDEPSIKGTAQVAASVGLATSGGFAAGFKDTNGCTGISTQISWRNKLYVDILGLTQLNIYDTNDKLLAQNCIALPALPAAVSSTTAAASAAAATAATDASKPTTAAASAAAAATTAAADASQPSTTSNPDSSAAGDSTTDADPATDTTPARLVRSLLETLDRRDDTNDTVVDLTSQVNSSTTTLTYSPSALSNDPYNGTDGYSYQLLTVPDGSMIFISCGNGAIYGVNSDSADNPACTEMWATYNDILIADGAQRLLHYYGNTMNATGVSRLRVADEESVPEGSVIVAFAAFGANDTEAAGSTDDGYYIAVDPDLNVYYPVLCTYTDGQVAKLFVVTDPVAGLTVLQSPDVEFSITGGVVGTCYAMPILMGSWGADYDSADNSTSDADTLSLDDGVVERVRLV